MTSPPHRFEELPMFALRTRIFIVLFLLVFSVYKLANGIQSGYLPLLAAAVIAIGYFRYGAIRPAFMAMMRGDVESASRHVETIRFARFLSAESQAYLHWVNGWLASQNAEKLDYAVEEMRLAIEGSLRTRNDRCAAMIALVEVLLMNDEKTAALELLEQAEQIPCREKTTRCLNDLKTKLEKEIN